MTWPNMALTKHGFKTKFGLKLGERTVEKREEEEEEEKKKGREEEGEKFNKQKGIELLNLSMDLWFV